jgi:uncharacterized protein YndB with AHSA1/START domain
MSLQRVHVAARSDAPVEKVWAVLADARRWKEWTALRTSELEREGSPDPDGVGALRLLGAGPVRTREEVVEFEPPHRLVYEMRSGMPIRGYRAEVTLTSWGAGTEIAWRSRFEPLIPGTGALLRVLLGAIVGDLARRMARRAERV